MTKPSSQRLSVFLSYAREDCSELAHELRIALGLLHFDVRVDVANILAPERWQEKIDALIDGSAAFLLLLSPKAATSKHVEKEWRKAMGHHKRLVVVRTGGITEADVPTDLAHLQHILGAGTGKSGAQGSFASMLQVIQDALLTNVEWVAEHNRLAGLARDWSRQPALERRFYTLNASQIQHAKVWREKWNKEPPEPTSQHDEYIKASGAEVRSRLWRRRGEISVAIVILAAVVTLAVLYRELRVDNRVLLAKNEEFNASARKELEDLPKPAVPAPASVTPDPVAVSPPASSPEDKLVSEFDGPNRRPASNRLVELYKNASESPKQQEDIVRSLVGGLQPKSALKSYRVNLYVLVTLARMPGWAGDASQREKVKEAAAMYPKDPIYLSWAEQALRNASSELR